MNGKSLDLDPGYFFGFPLLVGFFAGFAAGFALAAGLAFGFAAFDSFAGLAAAGFFATTGAGAFTGTLDRRGRADLVGVGATDAS
jgi:hypothetical protein